MTDYTKMIKTLRECANWFEAVAASSQYAHDELMALHYGDKLRDAADALESADKRIAELMPKEGVWIWDSDTKTYHCSECNATSPQEDQDGEYIDCPKYCPNCGARMRKGKQNE